MPISGRFFAFESGLNRKIIAKNRETAENLKDGKGFIYKVFTYSIFSYDVPSTTYLGDGC